ncbi:hypothetical protein Tco_1247789 [Tanacetum coccineum]
MIPSKGYEHVPKPEVKAEEELLKAEIPWERGKGIRIKLTFVVSASVVAGLVFFSPLAGEAVTGPAKDTPLLLDVWDAFSIMLAYLVKVLATLFRRLRSVSKV